MKKIKCLKNIIVLIVILISLSGCIKDYDINPATTIVRQLVNLNKNAK